jgi:hypothetical protein
VKLLGEEQVERLEERHCTVPFSTLKERRLLDHRWLKTTTPISFACRVTIEIMTLNPPAKKHGACLGNRTINGVLLDVRGAAVLFGVTEKTLRARVARHLKQLTTQVNYIRKDLSEIMTTEPPIKNHRGWTSEQPWRPIRD